MFIETGPHKHTIQQRSFRYVYEPGGNRIGLCNRLARLILAPDWKTITWTEAERAKGQAATWPATYAVTWPITAPGPVGRRRRLPA